MNIRIVILVLLVCFIFIGGCASKRLSKTSFKEMMYSVDYYEYVETNKSPKGRTFTADILPCFDIDDLEFKNTINAIAVECWERELEDAPETLDLSSSEFKSIQNSVSLCAYTNVVGYANLKLTP